MPGASFSRPRARAAARGAPGRVRPSGRPRARSSTAARGPVEPRRAVLGAARPARRPWPAGRARLRGDPGRRAPPGRRQQVAREHEQRAAHRQLLDQRPVVVQRPVDVGDASARRPGRAARGRRWPARWSAGPSSPGSPRPGRRPGAPARPRAATRAGHAARRPRCAARWPRLAASRQWIDAEDCSHPCSLGLVLLSLNLRPGRRQRRPGAHRGPRRARDVGRGRRAAHLPAGDRVRRCSAPLAPAAARRIGPHRVTLLALVAAAAGLLGRSLVDHEAAFLALSLLALGGLAMANVLIPSLVKRHYPDRIGTMTAVYTTALAIGLTSAFVLTVPVAAGVRVLAGRARRLGRARGPGRPPLARPRQPRHPRPRLRPEPEPRHRVPRRRPHPAGLGDGGVLRAAVAAGVRRVRLVRDAVAGRRLQRRPGRRARRGRGRDVDPALGLVAPGDRQAGQPAAGADRR